MRENQYQDEFRNVDPRSEAWVIDPDMDGPGKPFTVYCDMKTDLPVGITVVKPRPDPFLCTDTSLATGAADIGIKYLAADRDNINNLTGVSSHCEQVVTYDCQNAPIIDGLKFGAHGSTGAYLPYWIGPNDKHACTKSTCNCAKIDDKTYSDSGKFTDKVTLPLSKIAVPSVKGQRKLCVKELRCYNLPRTCDEYNQQKRLDSNKGNRNNIWAIDPDQGGGEEYFGVLCKNVGDTVVTETLQVSNPQVVNSTNPSSPSTLVSYIESNMKQIHNLIDISSYCSQKLDYFCVKSETFKNKKSVLVGYDDNAIITWVGADRYGTSGGCACDIIGRCPTNTKCRCDALLDSRQYEGGIFTNKNILPIKQINSLPGQNIEVYLYPIDCGSKPFGLPKDCIEARTQGYIYDTEVLIKPNGVSQPYLVFCQMSAGLNQDLQISIVTNIPTSLPNVVLYPAAPIDDIKALVQNSIYCLQPMKVVCQGIMFSASFTWVDSSNVKRNDFGTNNPTEFCPCGLSNACAGILGETRESMIARQCSCDTPLNDNKLSDSVLITDKTVLPIISFNFSIPTTNSKLNVIKVGPLMCSSSKFDFDECQSDFHDCNEHATCTNLPNGFSCACNPGWQGLGGNEMYSNGRSCIDDNECVLLKCPSVSNCVNTPGSFICNCFPGFKKTSATVCEDVNECSQNSSICDTNANCVNTYGSYICSCNPGYRGSGQPGDCQAVATCGCWGDPHCIGFDGSWLHYQGLCKYTLVRDQCKNGLPAGSPKFEVIMKNWDQNQDKNMMVSWAKEITVKLMSYTIVMKIGLLLIVNGQKTSIPFRPKYKDGTPVGFQVSFYGSTLRLATTDGLEVKWDGESRVDVTVTSSLQSKVCGLCGNYNLNPQDDWIIGPKCSPSGNITDSLNLFGDSWKNDDPLDTDPACPKDICRPTPPEIPCSADVLTKGKLVCEQLKNIFQACETAMKKFNKTLDDYISSCIYDQCHSNGDKSKLMCSAAESLAQKCLVDYKVTVIYRSENFCNLQCGENMVYETCASPCQPTCTKETSMFCITSCMEGCVCRPGYVLDNGTCIKPEQCGCLMADGTYYKDQEQRTNQNCSQKCRCNRLSSQLDCVNITCSGDASCDFKDNDYGCHCTNGFMGDGIHCKDIDECSRKPSVCDANARCNNTVGGYTCTCNEGFEGNGVQCSNINECSPVSPCNKVTEECFDKVPGYECRCTTGFMKNPTSGKCEDKNECADTGNLCDRVSTTCNNTIGSYLCDCKYGFRPSPVDTYICTDVDECKVVHDCNMPYAKCTNTPGSYFCTCNNGFRGNGRNCTDIDECSTNQVCQRPDATCVNLPGSYECRCRDGKSGCDGENPCNSVRCNSSRESCYLGQCLCQKGFKRNKTTDQCDDVDECSTGENDCSQKKAKCTNLVGGYGCDCLYGYRMSLEKKSCENIDECKEDSHRCGKDAECIDTDGGYFCQCKKGFTGHCDECRDVDECALSTNNCDPYYSTCLNSIGSYRCQCNAGYSGNGSLCLDDDECKLGTHNCTRPHQFCSNTRGGFVCKCSSGYILDKYGNCIDDNECLYAANGCHAKADCFNKEGTFSCICRVGYKGSGRDCVPMDGFVECGKTLCPLNSQCINNSCQCKIGYQTLSNQCININECKNQTTCDINANCIDTPGSFVCHCKDGYVGNGFECFRKANNIDVCKSDSFCIDGDCYDGICHCPKGYTYKSNKCVDERCKNACPPNAICSISSGSVLCSCSIGTSLSSDNSECIDIDECSENGHDCQDYSMCVNQYGFYDCKCSSGYLDVFGDGKICKFVKPTQCPTPCATGQYCKDGICSCLPGLIPSKKNGNYTCSKASDSCLPGTCPLNAVCEERLFGYLCHCKPGYEGIGVKSCRDINECIRNKHSCSSNEVCLNLPGSFNCSCKEGYSRNSSTGLCQFNNKCNCGTHGMCDKDNKCVCKSGYGINGKGICEDINECLTTSPCHILAQCTNTQGSYKCQCPDNYYGDPAIKCMEDKCKTKALLCQTGEECTASLYGSVCQKKTCKSKEILVGNDCLPDSEVCKTITCRPNASCKIENGRADCFCDSGYFGDGESCINIDECSRGLVKCPDNSHCQDTHASFFCVCNVGFERGSNSNASTDRCTDIDECRITKSCAPNAKCQNSIGSFQCDCKAGFIGDGRYSCQIDSKCQRFGGCHKHASCVMNSAKSIYECKCDSGYSGDGVASCIIDNLCFQNGKSKCHQNARCSQINSTYMCACPSGFQGDGYNFCNDIDECASDTGHNCSSLEKCVNVVGHFTCVCGDGATIVDGVCTDINECKGKLATKCSSVAVCHNTMGSYNCRCKDGYQGDGVNCIDMDECKLGTANCSLNALCRNTPGSFACECQAGTMGDGVTCNVDIDECSKPRGSPGAAECDENAKCINKNPGYRCECKPGFRGTGWFCARESPCDKPLACSVNETCTPSDDYSQALCECKPDYHRMANSRSCVPKKECDNGTDKCDRDSSDCVQLDRGYRCDCKPGYKKVGNECKDKNECDPTSGDYAAEKCIGSGGGCLNTGGSFLCTCSEQQKNSASAGCKPIDMCATKLDRCNRTVEKCVSNTASSTYTCTCVAGFQKINGICSDVNECDTGTHSCKNNATCTNTIGSYVCTCPDNLKLDSTKRSCIDRNECLENPLICGDLSRCLNRYGSYSCQCITGYYWNGTHCKDVDECANNTHPCHAFAKCSNTPGSCTCKCKSGYSGDGIYKCSEIDSCLPTEAAQCPKGTYCKKVDNITYCNCSNGYQDTHSDKCSGSVCYQDCVDINECLTNKHACHELASCTNNEGAYICSCPSHLVGDGKLSCEDRNECALNYTVCNATTSYCENLNNSINAQKPFQCHCFKGYIKVPGTEVCVNKNECLNPAENDCAENTKCVDTDGSFECRCELGYKPISNSKCIDTNECDDKLDTCPRNSICENTVGSFRCPCKTGFQSTGSSLPNCDDINECENPTSCSNRPGSRCMNNPGSFECVCLNGFSLQGGSCTDINECVNPNVCGVNGKCFNTEGGFNCTCTNPMRQLPNGDCEFVNECIESLDRCKELNGPASVCQDLPIGYSCSCPSGFTNDPSQPSLCIDVNECLTNRHNCYAGSSTCSNTYGSYRCVCNSGYSEDKSNGCVDIDECSISKNRSLDICKYGTCTNTQGGYLCKCFEGYVNINNQCLDVDECSLDQVSSMAGKCDPVNGQCLNTIGSYKCTCNKGYNMIKDSSKCGDINECSFPNICVNGICNNLQGSFECICDRGFTLVNGKCQDKDECVETPTICGSASSGICINQIGFFRCQCNVGYENSGGKSNNPCQVVNECVKQNVTCPPNARCVDRPKGYECICKDGYKEDEIGLCRNINECQTGKSCHYQANCTDTDGSYECSCKFGYKGDGKISCEAVCGPNSCPPNQMCSVIKGDQFECSCQCQGEKCSQIGPVCGTDGITYLSAKQRFETACKQQKTTEIEYYHECKASCVGVICPGVEVCSLRDGRPKCDCENCTSADLAPREFCASGGLQFPSVCEMKKWICQTKYQVNISYDGPCRRSIDCQLSEWSVWSDCSKTCGIGKSVRKRQVVNVEKFGGKCDNPLLETAQCFDGPCRGDVCENMTCAPGSFCEAGKCICPDCSGQLTAEFICGKIGDKQSGTFRTFCTMIHNACMLNSSFTYIHKGVCGDHVPAEPEICTMITNFKIVQSSDNCTSTEPVRTNLCSGGCGKNPSYCCRPLSIRILRVKFKCLDNSFIYREVKSIASCHCKLEGSSTMMP